METEDWLQDPLRKLVKGSYKHRELKNPTDTEQNDWWWSFHFATRLKLDGADHFCRQVLGAASMSYDRGLPLLAHRKLEWYLGAFFFELISAYDTLLQELNIVYAYDLHWRPERVRWSNGQKNEFMKKLPNNVFQNMAAERKKDWFHTTQWCRHTAAHRYLVPLSASTAGVGRSPLDYTDHTVFINYFDRAEKLKSEEVKVCKDYLTYMAKHIVSIWEIMKKEFK